jgi:hypothetical protein
VACKYTDQELKLIGEEAVAYERVFLSYALEPPVAQADVDYIAARVLEALSTLGNTYRCVASVEPRERGRIQVFRGDVRISDRTLLTREEYAGKRPALQQR